jgi:circadian clock protein KaiC
VVTAERGDGALTRHGIEEYVADCVILLDHRLHEQISTRRLRVIKYRGSTHGTNEYPFVIGEHGLALLPITALGLEHRASDERVSTGMPQLDAMLGGQGFYRGSSVLISGAAGTGKTSLAMTFLDAACRRGERGLAFCFEESPEQLMRNMRAIGLDLRPWVEVGLLHFVSARPTLHGLEMHLMRMLDAVRSLAPQVLVVDPITTFGPAGSLLDITAMLARLLDSFKARQITTLCTSLTGVDSSAEQSEVGVSSLVDTWLLLRNLEANGERNRGLYVLKARGIGHSNQIRELLISDSGLSLADVYTGTGNVLTGTARRAAEAAEHAEELRRRQELEQRQQELERRRLALTAQIASLQADLAALERSGEHLLEREVLREQTERATRAELQRRRQAAPADEQSSMLAHSGASNE